LLAIEHTGRIRDGKQKIRERRTGGEKEGRARADEGGGVEGSMEETAVHL